MATKQRGFAMGKPGSDMDAPPEIGAPPKAPVGNTDQEPDSDGDDNAPQPGLVTLKDMGFRDGSEVCANCKWFDQQESECEKAQAGDTHIETPDGAGCHGFESGSGVMPGGNPVLPSTPPAGAGGGSY